MKVRCVANTGGCLSEISLQAGYTQDFSCNLVIGKEYTVYGMVLWKGSLDYVLVDDNNFPIVYAAELFEVKNHVLPPFWIYSFMQNTKEKGGDNSYIAMWGYKEIASDLEHYYNLILHDKDALRLFKKRKKQIDEYEELYQFTP